MSYAVKEAFLTLQGEGVQAGSRAVFLRFAGCNLWSGREQDRESAVCRFCDTDFVGTDGEGGGKFADAEALANKATKAGVEGEGFTLHAPLQQMSKADIAREAARLGLDAGMSHSCYDPSLDGRHCGECDACRLRAKGFAEAGIADPTRYA